MKKSLACLGISLAIALCMALSVMFAVTGAYALPASGFNENSEAEPHIIANEAELTAFAEYVNAGNATSNMFFRLDADIDLSDVEYHPAGRATSPFNGTFDGNGHKVTLNISQTSDYAGLFGYVGVNATVKNLTVDGSVTGANYCGGIAGVNGGLIENCYNYAAVTVASAGGICFGGIAGENIGVITGCVNAGTMSANNNVGGITGKSYGERSKIIGCVNFGTIERDGSSSRVGGIVGEIDGVIRDCYNNAAIQVQGERIGSGIGYLISVKDGGRVYNISDKSTRPVVGTSEINVPNSIETKTVFDFLSNGVDFEEDALQQPEFDVGYGYLHFPANGNNFADNKNLFRRCLFSSGEGSAATPFAISDLEDWTLFATNTAIFDYRGISVVLNSSLVLGEITPLSSAAVPFNGSFNGGKNTLTAAISGGTYTGLFAKIGAYGKVSELKLTVEVTSLSSFAGALAGQAEGEIIDVKVAGNVNGVEYVGGIAGHFSGKATNCENSAQVNGVRYVGGIAGYAKLQSAGNLINSGSVGMSNGNGYSYFGGIFGYAEAESAITAEYLINKSAVSAYRAAYTGGLIGYSRNVSMDGVSVSETVSGRENVGGLIGYSAVKFNVNNAMVIANVNGASYVGGFIGAAAEEIAVNSSYFSGVLGTVEGAQIDLGTFRTVAPSRAVLTNVFYNSDLIFNGTDGEGKSYVQLTEQNFSSSKWMCMPAEIGKGHLPFINTVSLISDSAFLQRKIVTNYFGGGTGMEGTPFLIGTELHLRNLSYLVNKDSSSDYDVYYKQSADISFVRAFSAIGTQGFGGYYDGAYRTLNNLTFLGERAALFDTLSGGATVIRVAIESCETTVSSIAVEVESGATIEKCYSIALINGTDALGGIANVNAGIIKESFFVGRINGTGTGTVGGIAAVNDGSIINCFTSAYISSNGTAGGIAGKNNGEIKGCTVSGTVNISGSGINVGGLVGSMTGGSFEDCMILAIITVDGAADTQKKAGILAGSSLDTIAFKGKIAYNGDVISFDTGYYLNSNPISIIIYKTTADAMVLSSFLQGFATDYVSGPQRDKDSDYAPINAVFTNTGIKRVEELSAEAVKLRLFGWDNASEAEWGSESNPYIIDSVSRLRTLSSLTADRNDYSGNYFKMTADIDMANVSDFRPIGRYAAAASADNRIFNGVFDGNGHCISNLVITEEAVYGHVGLFAYTGNRFVLKNLTLTDSCTVSTKGNYAGSLAGYNSGKIIGCISYAAVSASNFVGGLTAYSVSGSEITHSVFAGTVPEGAANAYGITGQIIDSVVINTLNSWYVKTYDHEFYVEAGRENYVHNDYGSVLFVDRGGSVAIERTEDGFVFRVIGTNNYRGFVMTSQDGIVYEQSDSGFNPLINATVSGGGSVKFYARFAMNAEIKLSSGIWNEYFNSDSYGAGYYYRGQQVRFTLSPKYGYFIVPNNSIATQVSNSGENVIINFAMPDTTGEVEYSISVLDFNKYVDIHFEDNAVYDGTNKSVSLNTVSYDFSFGELTATYYYGETLALVQSICDAGSYTVKVPIRPEGATYFVGTAVKKIVVDTKKIEASTDANDSWKTIAVKTYDGYNYLNGKSIGLDLFNGFVTTDTNSIEITADIEWSTATAGEQNARIFNFKINGSRAFNYNLDEVFFGGISVTDAVINRKTVTVSIADEHLKGQYNGNSPSITPILSTSIGSASIIWSYAKLLDGEATTDNDWASLPDNLKTWNVGSYLLTAACSDALNYDVQTDTDYRYTIEPRVISEIRYEGYYNLEYNGENLSNRIRGQYTTVNSGIGVVNFEFSYLENPVVEVVNAGVYTAKPIVTDQNYILADVAEPLVFNVARNKNAGEFSVTLNNTTVGIEEEELLTVGEIYGATLSVEKDQNSRGEVNLVKKGDQYYIMPVKYSNEERFRFRLKASDSLNYEDRYSGYLELNIIAGVIYVGIAEENRTMVFGDEPIINLVYSFDIEMKSLIENIDNIRGFNAPTWEINALSLKAGNKYDISLLGGSSDGYLLQPSTKCDFEVTRRKITIVVTQETVNEKYYGDKDGAINFSVTHQGSQLDLLPDGSAPILNGALTRETGENAGKYVISVGTLTNAQNPDYEISYNISGEFTVKPRELELVIDGGSKEYGTLDPKFTFSLAEGYSYAEGEGAESIKVAISREEGESVGRYSYRVIEYNGNGNYTIARIDARTNVFEIVRATPAISFNTIGTIRYGDNLRALTLTGDAVSNGRSVSGAFSWVEPEFVPSSSGVTIARFKFVPDDVGSYAQVFASAEFTVLPRIAEIVYSGQLEYIYNGLPQCNIIARVSNLVGEDEITLNAAPVTQPVNVGEYVFRVTMEEKDYILANGKSEIAFAIYPATVNVYTSGGMVDEGDIFVPEITYDGFVNGETESVLTRRATVSDIPVKGGIYNIIPSGAAAENYTFLYNGASLIVKIKDLVSDNVVINGNFDLGIDLNVKKAEGILLNQKAKSIDKALKYNVFIPNNMVISEYYQLDYGARIEGVLEYSVRLSIKEGDKIYLSYYDGRVEELADYEVGEPSEDGTVEVKFAAEQTLGVAVYSKKGVPELLKGYIPLAVSAGGLAVLVAIVILAVGIRRRKFKREQYYRKRLDR